MVMMNDENLNTDRNRIGWIDIGKGIGILLVVLGHSFRDSMRADSFACNYIYEWIYTFHMAYMMYLSGYMFAQRKEHYKKMGAKKFCFRKLIKLLKPYLIYSTVVYACMQCAFLIKYIATILRGAGYENIGFYGFIEGLLLGKNAYAFHLWYIYALAVIELVAYFLIFVIGRLEIDKHTSVILTGLSICFIIYSLATIDAENKIPVLAIARSMMPWFLFGYLSINSKISVKISIPLGLISFVLLGILPYTALSNYAITYRVIRYLLIMFTICLFVESAKWLGKNPILQLVGQKSMAIYLFHQPFIAAGTGVLLYDILHVPIIISVIIVCIVSIIVPLVIEKLLDALKLYRLIF